MHNLAGKAAFITGGASGIRLGMARAGLAAGLQRPIAGITRPQRNRRTQNPPWPEPPDKFQGL
jgi:NAD(P)-dependent dehydrogenase (short-subunit alcohol dehydrogenase family)